MSKQPETQTNLAEDTIYFNVFNFTVYFGVLPCILPCILTFYRVFWRFPCILAFPLLVTLKMQRPMPAKHHAKIHGETPKYMQNTRPKKTVSIDEIVAVAAATIKYTENTR